MRKGAIICRSYRTLQVDTPPEGAFQTRCRSCGYPILLSSDITETRELCSNHPDVLSVGACDVSGRRFCENCLYIYQRLRDNYVCEACSGRTKNRARMTRIIIGVVTVMIAVFFIPPRRAYYPSDVTVYGLFLLLRGSGQSSDQLTIPFSGRL